MASEASPQQLLEALPAQSAPTLGKEPPWNPVPATPSQAEAGRLEGEGKRTACHAKGV